MAKSAYVPTGRPPGRPKVPQVVRQNVQDVRARLKNTNQDPRFMPLDAICPDCFPDGWPEGVHGRNCQHGTWVRRLS